MQDPVHDFIGIGEIAVMAGVSKQAVVNWRTRSSDFPEAISDLSSGPIFARSQVRSWLKKHKRRLPMAHVISTINLKGGVGKTTTSVALAEVFAGEMGKRVLIVDLDPQTNATIMAIGEDRWRELNKNQHTLARLFMDALEPENPLFDLEATLQLGVSDVRTAQSIDLLPSSLDLIDVQDRLASIPLGRFYTNNPTEILRVAIKSIIDDYEIVIVDCPPNLGIVTLNGLRISDSYIIPTIPDYLSTYGIPQITMRVGQFADKIKEQITPLGIVITKFQENSTVHKTVRRQLQNDAKDAKGPKVFNTTIKQTNNLSAAAEYTPERRTLRQKYPNELTPSYSALAKEILAELE